jgi:hypothetical protein
MSWGSFTAQITSGQQASKEEGVRHPHLPDRPSGLLRHPSALLIV